MTPTPARALAALPAVALLLLLAGCGGGSSDDAAPASADSGSTASKAAEAPAAAGAGYASDTGDAAGSGSASRTYETRAVISKGSIQLRSTDVDATRDDLAVLLAGWGGTVENEQSSTDKHGHTDHQSLQLRVPVKYFDTAMKSISGLGTLVDRSRTSEDVTTQVIDTRVRIQAQKASIARVQALLAEATSINQVIAIESQLTQRQSELDSLEQQQAYLADQTAMSTIGLTIARTGTKAAPVEAEGGFLAGLEAGWERLGASTTAVLTAVGALLPFAAVAALVAAPFWWTRRRRAAGA
ncbi:DUF4349 domain-containing protein [Marmoricola sp. RAF53]|uniref:DUF4349 domain-containing protein n=1 Tax=Marmoricola sp. RAF53 TaxID=3233059 RepID=UPI003F9C6679